MILAKQIVRNIFYVFSSSLINMGLAVVFTMLCARYLGVSGYGLYAFSLSIITISSVLSKFGLDLIAIRDVAKDRTKAKKYLDNITTLKIILALLFVAFISFYLFASRQPFDRQLIVFVFVLSAVFIMISDGFGWGFQAFQIMEYTSFIKVFQAILMLLSLIAVIFLKGGILMFSIAYLLATLVMAFTSYYYTVKKISGLRLELDLAFIKNIVLDAIPLGLMYVFTTIYLNLDNILISTMRGDIETGWYSAAYKLMAYVKVMLSYYFLVVFPAFSHFAKDSIGHKFMRLMDKSLLLILMVTFPISAGTSILSAKIITLFFGSGFHNSVGALNILIWILPISLLGTLFAHALTSINKQVVCGTVTLVGLIVNIAIDLAVIPRYGFIGAAYGILITEAVVALMFIYYTEKLIKFRPSLVGIARIIAAVGLMSVLTYLLRGTKLYLLIPISAASYVGLLFLLGAVTVGDLIMIRESFSTKGPLVDAIEYEQV